MTARGSRIADVLAWLVIVAAFVAIDAVTYVYPIAPLRITPWSPQVGFALAVMIFRGFSFAPAIFLGTLLAELVVRGFPGPPWAVFVAAAATTLIYASAAALLRRMDIVEGIRSLKGAFRLTVVSVIATAAAAFAYVFIFHRAGIIPTDDMVRVVSRYWIGDMTAVVELLPLAFAFGGRLPPAPRRELVTLMAAQALAIAAALWLIFGLGLALEYRSFYTLLLPLIWIGARFGISGAAVGNLAAQLGLLVAVFLVGSHPTAVTTFQYLMLAVITGSLFLGAAVSERRQVEEALRLRQDELAHFSRLSMAGEMAAALAHELNQPLTATVAFVRAGQRMLAAEHPDIGKAGGALDRAVAEAQRAGEIVRSLREFIGKGGTRRAFHSVTELVADSVVLAEPDCRRRGVRLVAEVDRRVPPVRVDRVQIQQVLLNLVRNAAEAMGPKRGAGAGRRDIIVTAWPASDDTVEVEVRDTGPGIEGEVAEHLFQPFNTTKPRGMGLGLSISRSMVEAHGGRLWLAENGDNGAAFHFTLPVAGGPDTETGEAR
ncbi:MAG: ATP-binding protein [Solirubrobacterales bacterium]